MTNLKRGNKIWKISAVLIVFIIISIVLSAFWGSANLSFSEVINVFLYKISPDKYPLENRYLHSIVWELRLPRILLAIAIGSGLSVCGATMQALTRNVMAEPYTLGVASGASTMAAISIAYFNSTEILGGMGTSIAAFIGAVIAMVLVYAIAASKNGASNTRLILTGIAISMFCSALTQFIISTVPNESKIKGIVFWTMGGLGGARWSNIGIPIIVAFAGCLILYSFSENMNLLAMGNETATILGISVGSIQKKLIVIISAITGTMVAAGGCIGFIGLIIPHVVRRLIGSDHRKIIPVCALLGSFFMIWTDTIARWILSPRELPIGVLTSLIGAPFFLILLRKDGRR